jgi:Animal haem peroxidase
MFPSLPHLDIDASFLHAIGLACDASGARRQEAVGVAAGWPIFGQFIAHDITADRSPVTHHDDEALVRNARSARLNLEALYGEGPTGNPYMYSHHDPSKLLLGGSDDLPRNSEGIALVGDPRQDVHGLMSQMQVRMIKAHNKLVDRLREDGVDSQSLFEEAQRALRWHYQWVCLFDFLPAVIGRSRTEALLSEGPRYYRPEGTISIPFEFADAAFRFGHSQVRESYQLSRQGPSFALFPDLIGFRPVPPSRVVDWTLFFDVPGFGPAQRSRPIDGCLPPALVHLPVDITGDVDDADFESLAVRDLQRGSATGLPSGEAVAALIGAGALSRAEVGLSAFGWSGETPLWYYVVKEAAVLEDGERLGPVGSLIVGEVLLGIVDGDPESFRSVDPSWKPTLPSRDPSRFTVADLLLAG